MKTQRTIFYVLMSTVMFTLSCAYNPLYEPGCDTHNRYKGRTKKKDFDRSHWKHNYGKGKGEKEKRD